MYLKWAVIGADSDNEERAQKAVVPFLVSLISSWLKPLLMWNCTKQNLENRLLSFCNFGFCMSGSAPSGWIMWVPFREPHNAHGLAQLKRKKEDVYAEKSKLHLAAGGVVQKGCLECRRS